jgi:hypothetical protein
MDKPVRFTWTRRGIERLTWMSLEGETPFAIAAKLRCNERTVRKMQWELELTPHKEIHRWTRKERAVLRRLYPTTRTADIAQQLGVTYEQVYRQAHKLELKKDLAVIAEMARERTMRPDHGSRRTRFVKGQTPANKGLRRPGWAPGRMRETQFRKGERRGQAARNWKPVGTILADDEGYLRIKVRESNDQDKAFGFGNTGIWPLMQRHIWQQHKGPIPPNHTVCFIDGDRKNCAIENLELLSRAELMRRNTIHRYPEQLRNTIMLLGAVKRKVREQCQKTQ